MNIEDVVRDKEKNGPGLISYWALAVLFACLSHIRAHNSGLPLSDSYRGFESGQELVTCNLEAAA